jgi:putative methyltransferase
VSFPRVYLIQLGKVQEMGFKKKVVKRQVVEIVKESGKDAKANDPTKMPNTFKFAAEALRTMSERGGSAGSIVVNKYKSYNYKLIFALVMNTAKNIKIIKKIIHNLKLANEINESNPFMLEILIGDLLFGKGLKSVQQNPVAAAIINKKEAIIKEQTNLGKEFSNEENGQTVAKYLRINHLKSDMNHVISQLKTIGLIQLEYSKDKIKFKKFINKFKTLEDDKFMVDFHFPQDLIIVKPSVVDKIKKLDLIKKNKVTIQDKASYMAVEALDPQPSHKIIDACFAPGCKTSLIASKMKNKGKILAYDINKKRLVDAIRFLKLQGVSCVRTELQDFSKVKLRRLHKVTGIETFDSILIDPSCSGSGIKSRVDYKKSDKEAGRLKKLQAFQVSLLKHALQARISKTIVYCTCSTSIEENEQVVEMALKESGVSDKWEIVEVLPYWPNRGDSNYEFGNNCLRSDSDWLTNGFFIAKLKCNEIHVPPKLEETKKDNKRKRIKDDELTNDENDDSMDNNSMDDSAKDDESMEDESMDDESNDNNSEDYDSTDDEASD